MSFAVVRRWQAREGNTCHITIDQPDYEQQHGACWNLGREPQVEVN